MLSASYSNEQQSFVVQYKRDNKENLFLSTLPAKMKHQLQIILDDSSSGSVTHLNLKRLKDAIVSG